MTTPATVRSARPVRMVNMSTIRVTVWGENYHEHAERDRAGMAERYPEGMHGAIAAGLREVLGDAVQVRTATRDQPEHGLTDDVLKSTDVLTWWGHARHAEIDDAIVDRVHRRVLGGMGLLVLHSGHFAKIFTRLMGTTCSLAWRNSADTELVWTVSPAHPIARGVPHPIVIEEQEMYGEYFDIPAPDELVFLSTFSSGEVFRSGCCWRRGKGKVFYFSPGDQDYPVYHHPDIRRVLANAVQWATPDPDLGVDLPGVVAQPAPRFVAATRVHAPIAVAALDAGVHVLSEKPLAENAEAGERMVEAAERNQRVLDVSFNHRRRGVVKALKQLIDEGTLGPIYYAKA